MPSADLISKKTRQEFREYFVGTTLRVIEMAFDAADIECDTTFDPKVGGARRSFVEQYYHTINFAQWSDVRRLLKVYEQVLVELETQVAANDSWSDNAKKSFDSLRRWLERDGFTYSSGRLTRAAGVSHLDSVQAVATTLDAPELHRQIERMREAAHSDPGLAVGTAKELLETTCKTILMARGVTVEQGWELPQLLKETRGALALLPDQMPDGVRGLEVIRKLLGNLGALAVSLAELRNLYGTGHGKHATAKGLQPRHARLAVGSAATLATFLFETHQERDR